MSESGSLLVVGARPLGGPVGSVLFENGKLAAIGEAADRAAARRPVERLELAGYLLLPAGAEPHAHLDKALLGERTPNPDGDLSGAIAATRAAYATMTPADVETRARRALEVALARGFTAVRTHVDCEQGLGTGAVRALVALRETVRPKLDLQVFAMAGTPFTGNAGRENRRLLDEALDAGADGIGGVPAHDESPDATVALLVAQAAETGLPIDLHLDETIDPASLTVAAFADELERYGIGERAVASHCVSLGQVDADVARGLAARLASVGASVVTLPRTNLFLQGRRLETRQPRGLTAIGILRAAGVNVAAGGDNWRDAFNPTSRIDPMETASLLVVAAHLGVPEAYDAVSTGARRAMGLPAGGLAVGSECDVLAIATSSLADAVADAGDARTVIRRGQVIARRRVVEDLPPGIDLDKPLSDPTGSPAVTALP